MKRIFSAFLLLLMFAGLMTPVTVKADEKNDHPSHNVVDDAGLLSSSEYNNLDNYLKERSKELDFDIVVVTTHDLGGKSPMEYCDDFYDYNHYGLDKENSGVCFLSYIAEDGSDYDVRISTTGQARAVFGDIDIQDQIDLIADDIIAGRYYSAFVHFGDNVSREVKYYRSYKWYWIPVGIIAGLIIGGTSTATMKKALKSVAPAGYATEYIKRGSFKLTNKSDTFLFKNVTRVAIPKSSSGSSSHRGSSGVSHGGGGRHI